MGNNSSTGMFSEIDNILECPNCKSSLKDPKLLPCLHIYCRPCLERILSQSAHPGELSCPSCQAEVPLNGQVADLPDAPIITSMEEAVDKLKHLGLHKSPKCTVCSETEVSVKAHFVCVECMNVLCESCLPKHNLFVQNHGIDISKKLLPFNNIQLDVLLQNRTPTCSEHGEAVSNYCATCQKTICSVCEGEHLDHTTKIVQSVVKHQKEVLKTCIEKIHNQEQLYDEKIRNANAARNTCLDQGDFTKSQIKHHGDKLIKQIQENVRSLHDAIDEETAKIVDEIEKLKETLELEKSRLTNASKYICTSLKFGNDADVISMSDKVQAFETLLEHHQASHAIPALDAELQLIELDNFKLENTIGMLHYKAKCGSLTSKLVRKYSCDYHPSDVVCTGDKNNVVVCKLGGASATMYSTEGTKTATFQVPSGTQAWGTACTEQQVYITDSKSGSVLVFDYQGKHIKSIPVGIKGPGFIAICGTTAYVTSQDDNRVYRLTLPDGQDKTVFLQQSDGIEKPFCVAASPTRVAITSNNKHTVHVFNTVGRLQFLYSGICVPGPEQLYNPRGIALDGAGRVMVADSSNRRIVVLSPIGHNFGNISLTPDDQNFPQGLSINSEGQLVIGCFWSNNIEVYQYRFE